MSTMDSGPITQLDVEIGKLMPMALDMIGDVVDAPGMSVEDYEAITAVVETQSPVLFLALLRAAAGLAAIVELSGDDVRALAPPDGR